MSKHQEILDYLEALPIGKRVSVRSISNHLQVSDGTAYRAIKEAENRGLVETRPRSGTVRIEKKVQVRLDRLTFAEIAEITESEVISGHEGLERVFSKFYIGAMTIENITRYLTKGDLLIVGDREDIQLLALEHNNAILVTGGFQVSDRVKELSRLKQFPVMVTTYDTFTVATMINQALSNVRIKTDIKTVAQVYTRREDYNYMTPEMTVRDFQNLVKRTNLVRFPILSESEKVIGIVTMRDVSNQQPTTMLKAIMTKPTVTRLETSLATVAQKMIFEDFDIIPVVDEEKHYLGVITRRQVLEELQDNNRGNLHTFSDQMIANLNQDKHAFSFEVEPTMIDNSGNLTQGVLAEMVKEVVYRIMEKQEQNGLVIEEMMFYFLQADTLEMKRFYQGIYQKFDTALFDRLQEFFPTIDTRRNIRRLSKGMQKQVAFWLSICAMPELMILDEPMDGLDPVMRRQIWSIILSKASENKTTILISSHNLRELEDVCDHVGIMHKGRIIVERSLSDLQGNVSKIQVAFQEGMPTLPPDFEILHMSNTGRVYTLIVKGDPERAKAILEATHPMLIDILPLTLEEIFIYEMGGKNYEIKDILF